MPVRVTALRWVPPFVQGYVKDLRVRWALEEAGLPYEASLLSPQMQASTDYLALQPFGQVPAYEDGTVSMFESGAIVLHIAAQSEALAPRDPAGWARTTSWVIAALNSVEPHAQNLLDLDDSAQDPAMAQHRQRLSVALERRLDALDAWLDGKDYLEGRFTAGDLVMATVLRTLVDSGVFLRFPVLDAYVQRCLRRPAFGRALEAQMQGFRENAPA